jgi:hypothetical protein
MSFQYFMESFLPALLAVLVLLLVMVATIWLAAWKAASMFMDIRLTRTKLLCERQVTKNQVRAATLYADAVALTLVELAHPNKSILRETIAPEAYSLLMEANASRADLPGFIREDRA